jgi:hypothetical protein
VRVGGLDGPSTADPGMRGPSKVLDVERGDPHMAPMVDEGRAGVAERAPPVPRRSSTSSMAVTGAAKGAAAAWRRPARRRRC